MRSLLLGVLFLASTALGTRVDSKKDKKSGRTYKLIYDAETWIEAKKSCTCKGGKLAVPKTQDELSVIEELLRGMKPEDVNGSNARDVLPWLGISGEQYEVWKNVDGDNIELDGYSYWIKPNRDEISGPRDPHCVGLDVNQHRLRSCRCVYRQPYVCEFEKKNVTNYHNKTI